MSDRLFVSALLIDLLTQSSDFAYGFGRSNPLFEIRRSMAETRKLTAEERKLRQKTFWYPIAVGAGTVTAIVAAVSL